VQKGVRAEDSEHKSEQDAGDDFNDFHIALIKQDWRNFNHEENHWPDGRETRTSTR
jgi:hypothetical protein